MENFVESVLPAEPAEQAKESAAFWRGVLLLPFLLVGVALLISHREFDVFWGADEHLYHFPLIQNFARQWPHFDFQYDGVATTPLYHLLGALLVHSGGAGLPGLRGFNLVISALGVLWMFDFLHRDKRLPPAAACLGAAVLMFSCYYFGYSFHVLTDNLALVFCLLAMISLHRFVAGGRGWKTFALTCLWFGLAVLTRQNCIFLGLPLVVALFWRGDLPRRERLLALAALVLALAPFVVLVWHWGGVVPPGVRARHLPSVLPCYPHSVVMPLAVLGFYALFFRGPGMAGWHASATARFGTVAGVVLLTVLALLPGPAGHEYVFSGMLQAIAGPWPYLGGWSLLIWLLVPVGTAALADGLGSAWRRNETGVSFAWLTLIALTLGAAGNHVAAQKYFDGVVLLCLLWQVRPEQAADARWRAGMGGLITLFCAYHLCRNCLG